MRGWSRPVRTGATVAAASALSGCNGEPGPWLFGSLALLIAALGGAGVGWLLARQRDRAALYEARQQARLIAQLAGGALWRSEAGQIRLADGRAFDEAFDAGSRADALRAQLQTAQQASPLVLSRRADRVPVELRSAPCFDHQGRFAGHLGLVRELDHDAAASAALASLAAAQAGPLIVLARRPEDNRWRVLQANDPARQHFGDAASIESEALAAALPAGLRAGLAADVAEAEAEGWQLRRLAAAEQTLCLLWQTGPGASDEQASFVYTVSHDLRAPIRVVEGFTRIVKEDYGPVLDRVANDHLDRVLGAAARMNQMIDAMLTLARLSTQPLARQPVNLSQLASFVVDDLRRAGPERDATIAVEPGMQTQGDPTLLRLVLENLLGNAWKYTARRAQTRIEFGRETVDGRTVYAVRDNGAGFDMRSAERLFGLFQRLHSANDFPGTGVGLASVRRIVQRHGGEIWADGETGRGAAFYFTLRA
jgi:signal transduction histidine kinase